VDDPFQAGRRVALVPALRPDFALVHAGRADPEGNAVISTLYDDRLLIQASRTVIMSVEHVEAGATDRLGPNEQLVPAAYLAALTAGAGPGRRGRDSGLPGGAGPRASALTS